MKNKKVKLAIAHLIGIMPTNFLRISLYKLIFNYRIKKSFIGWNTIIAVDTVELNECRINGHNKFIGPMHIIIRKGASIGKGNTFNCGWWTQKDRFKSAKYKCHLELGVNARISFDHYFDVAGAIILQENAWIGGCGSQFWTHGGIGFTYRDIIIGEDCYIGSAVRFSAGSSIGKNSIVGLGSIVTKTFEKENVLIAGQPAKILRENYDWKAKKLISAG